jgi:hypothetical protein
LRSRASDANPVETTINIAFAEGSKRRTKSPQRAGRGTRHPEGVCND